MADNNKKKEIIAFFITFVIGLITHFTIFLTESIAPDALYIGNLKYAGEWEVTLGRWGIAFFDTIRGGIINEALIIVICLIFLGIASIYVCKTLRIQSNTGIAIISCLLATAPQFSETFMFIYCADSYCFSALAAVLTAYFITKDNRKKYEIVLGILCGIISLSLYQAYIAIAILLILILYINKILIKELGTKEFIFQFIKDMIIILISMVCYLIITKIILNVNGLEFSAYKGANSLSISNIISNLPNMISNSYFITGDFLFGEGILKNSFWHRNIFNIILCILNTIFTIYVLIKNKVFKNMVNIMLLLILLAVLPIGINIISIIIPNTIMNIVTGPALLCIYFLNISVVERNRFNENLNNKFYKVIQSGTVIIISILMFTYIMSDNATYMTRQEVYTNYFTTSSNILQKVYNLEGYTKDKKWIFTDNIRYRSKFADMANGIISDDYETWDNIEGIWLNIQFYERYLGENINMASMEEYYKMVNTDEVKKMEAYPSKNCVKIIGDFVIVKIGNDSYKK